MEMDSSSNAEDAENYYYEMMQGWFHFVQTEDGSIPATYYSREEDAEIVNTKKSIVSAFQANFLGTNEKEEADPQSLHKAEYTYVECIEIRSSRTPIDNFVALLTLPPILAAFTQINFPWLTQPKMCPWSP